MNPPPPTPIFVKPDGAKLSIFAQADGNVNRPKLARRLKAGGAATCTNPKLADVILVDPNHTEEETGQPSAQAIIDAWGDSKVILDYRWAKHCLDEGKLVLEADSWGGFRVGASAEVPPDDDDREGALPTPRPSPENVQQQQIAQAEAATQYAQNMISTVAQFMPNGLPGDNAALSAQLTPDVWMSLCDIMSQSEDPAYQAMAQQMRGMGPAPELSSAALAAPRQGSPSTTPSRTASEEPLRAASKGKGKGKARPQDFFARYGKPIGFFVQVDHMHRREIIATIKAHGGAVQKDIEKADVAVLFSAAPAGSARAREYAALYKTATAAKVPCVGDKYIRTCVEKERMLDLTNFASKNPEKKRKKSIDIKAPESDSDDEPDIPLATQSQSTQGAIRFKPWSKPTPKPTPTVASEPAPAPKPKSVPSPQPQERVDPVPAPPQRKTAPIPPQHEIRSRENVARYTPAEFERAIEIAFEMYCEDPDATQNAISSRLGSEIPAHSVKSWNTTLFFRKRAEMDDAQRRGRIQYNKRQRQLKAAASLASAGSSIASMPPESPIETSPHIPSREELQQRDMEEIVDFFVRGEDAEFGEGEERNQNRGAIFEKLEKRTHCRSETDWTAFYNKHWKRVQELVDLTEPNIAQT